MIDAWDSRVGRECKPSSWDLGSVLLTLELEVKVAQMSERTQWQLTKRMMIPRKMCGGGIKGGVVVALWRPKVQVFFDLRGALSASWKMKVKYDRDIQPYEPANDSHTHDLLTLHTHSGVLTRFVESILFVQRAYVTTRKLSKIEST